MGAGGLPGEARKGPRRLLAVQSSLRVLRFARPRCCGFTSSNLRGPVHASAVNRACGGSGSIRSRGSKRGPSRAACGRNGRKMPDTLEAIAAADLSAAGWECVDARLWVRVGRGVRGGGIRECVCEELGVLRARRRASAEDLRRVTRAGCRASCGRMGRKLLDSGLPSNHATAWSPGPPQARFRHFPGRGVRASIRVNPQQRGRAKRGHAARTEPGSKPSHPSEANSARRQCGDRASRPAPRVTRPRRRARDPRSDRRRVRRRRTRG